MVMTVMALVIRWDTNKALMARKRQCTSRLQAATAAKLSGVTSPPCPDPIMSLTFIHGISATPYTPMILRTVGCRLTTPATYSMEPNAFPTYVP
jgi:hypothetical protein